MRSGVKYDHRIKYTVVLAYLRFRRYLMDSQTRLSQYIGIPHTLTAEW